MPPYVIDFTEEAKEDLTYYRAYERKVIVDGVIEQLRYQLDVETQQRKYMRDNPISQWELRLGKYRVFYEIDSDAHSILIISLGHKEHNVLSIRGRNVKI